MKKCCIYLDDALIYDTHFDLHLRHIRQLIIRSREVHLQWRLSKVRLCMPRLTYLGHGVSQKHCQPKDELVKKIQEFPHLKNTKEMKYFLFLLSYFRKFLRNLAVESEIQDLGKEKVPFVWLLGHAKVFEKLRDMPTSSDILALPDLIRAFRVQRNASDHAICAVLSQLDENNVERPVAFISRRLSQRECNLMFAKRSVFVWSY